MHPGREASEDASPAVPGFWTCRLQTARTARSPTSAVQAVQPVLFCTAAQRASTPGQRGVCTPLVPTALSMTGRTWKQPRPT